MKCPTIDRLSQYVDELLSEQDYSDIKAHIEACSECQKVVAIFKQENDFMTKTLQAPALSDDFATTIISQIEPYHQEKRKKRYWKKLVSVAAILMVAIGLSTSVNPAFAQWVGGLFSDGGGVDEGLQMASEAGFMERVNEEVTDQGLTFKVEDVVADTSRVVFSYQVLSKSGKLKNIYFDLAEDVNEVLVTTEQGDPIDVSSLGWGFTGDYGIIEFSTPRVEGMKEMIVTFQLRELDGKEGEWYLEIPVNLEASLAAATTVPLEESTNEHGVNVQLKEVRSAPSTKELFYETKFTDEEQVRIEAEIEEIEEEFGEEIVHSFTRFGTAISYHIVDESGKLIYQKESFFEDFGQSSDSRSISGSGEDLGETGHLAWKESFIPQRDEQNLSFVLDGMIKTEPADFEITFKPEDLKKEPISFEYEGNYFTIKEAKRKNNYSLRKSLFPLNIERNFAIEIKGSKEGQSSEMRDWVLIDEKGNAYPLLKRESIFNKTNEEGRYLTTSTLWSDRLDDAPEEITLRLLSVTRYYPVAEPWKMPLY
ncbi:DUF4179 domain-containing protein [Bacillus solitudinis]|uniref:DUF4179 domain-containing protein n=1 Tax=Bacillus solitudinis TaxID=2014074 RepID=UPI0018E22588|nr:DUF4179 domain-containing protein [Bacillus solitudinis]